MKKSVKIKNLCIIFAFILIFAIIFAGCSGNKTDNSANEDLHSSEIAEEYATEANFGMYADADIAYDMEAGNSVNTTSENASYTALSETANLPTDRKIIRDANISMTSETVVQAYNNILKSLETYSGYEANRDMNTDNGDYTTVHATLKIPADKLDIFLSGIQNEGTVISTNISSSDITDQYYDYKTRVTNLEKTLEKYYEFLENAKDVDEQLRVTRYINDITTEIEQLKGSINRWDSLVEYSTVSLYIYTPYKPIEPVEPDRVINWKAISFNDMVWLIKSGFVNVCSVIINIVQLILIAVLALLPVLIPVGIVIFFMIRNHIKKKKQKHINEPENHI